MSDENEIEENEEEIEAEELAEEEEEAGDVSDIIGEKLEEDREG